MVRRGPSGIEPLRKVFLLSQRLQRGPHATESSQNRKQKCQNDEEGLGRSIETSWSTSPCRKKKESKSICRLRWSGCLGNSQELDVRVMQKS